MSSILDGARDLIDKKEAVPVTKQVEAVLKLIAQHTFGCVVAGGYARDKHFGIKPKDIDICMYNFHPDDYAEQVLLNSLYEKLMAYGIINVSSQFDNTDEDYIVNDARVYEVWNLPALGVDIILYNNCKTWKDVVSQFDFNLNQFIIPSTCPDEHHNNGVKYDPDMQQDSVYVGDCPYTELVQIKSDLTPERVAKIHTKHSAIFPELYPKPPADYYKDDIPW